MEKRGEGIRTTQKEVRKCCNADVAQQVCSGPRQERFVLQHDLQETSN